MAFSQDQELARFVKYPPPEVDEEADKTSRYGGNPFYKQAIHITWPEGRNYHICGISVTRIQSTTITFYAHEFYPIEYGNDHENTLKQFCIEIESRVGNGIISLDQRYFRYCEKKEFSECLDEFVFRVGNNIGKNQFKNIYGLIVNQYIPEIIQHMSEYQSKRHNRLRYRCVHKIIKHYILERAKVRKYPGYKDFIEKNNINLAKDERNRLKTIKEIDYNKELEVISKSSKEMCDYFKSHSIANNKLTNLGYPKISSAFLDYVNDSGNECDSDHNAVHSLKL